MPASFPFPAHATNIPQLRAAAKAWAKENKQLPAKDAEAIITSLVHSKPPMKKYMAGILLGYLPVQRKAFDPQLYDRWLDHMEGWAAIDNLCYANFTAEEMLANFADWETIISTLVKSENENKRRGALVLLTKPVAQSADKRLSRLALHLIDQTKHEKDILLTKAVSWLLRSMTKLHKTTLENYLEKNKATLPAIALRETGNKLRTGRKSGKE
jgi:3-methyladenine DNA glycosylase AlkD